MSLAFNIPVFKRRSRHGFTKGRMPINRLKFSIESSKERDSIKGSNVFKDLWVIVSAFYYDCILRRDIPFSFIESIQDNASIYKDFMIADSKDKKYKEIFEQNINWNTKVILNFESGSLNPSNILINMLKKAQQTNLYLYAAKIQRYCKILDPNWDVVEMKIEYLKQGEADGQSNSNFILKARMLLYNSLIVTFNCRIPSGQFYIENSSFLNTKQIEILNEFIHLMEFKYVEIKTIVQILATEYFCQKFSNQIKQYFLHVVKSDRMIYHFSIKKAKCMHIPRTKNDIWDSVKHNMNLSDGIINKLKSRFYGNHLYVLLSPFDSMISLPIFNPNSIIKADKTYNFLTVEIPWDFLLKEDPRRPQFTSLPTKISDIEIKFFYGRIIDQEDAEMNESYNLVWFEKDLNLNPLSTLKNTKENSLIIEDLVKELVIYYKRNDQVKSHQTLFDKICKNVIVTQDNSFRYFPLYINYKGLSNLI